MNPIDAIKLLEMDLNLIFQTNSFEQRKLIGRINSFKIEIYPNEHAPPHFHIKSPEFQASFVIENCNLLDGYVDPGIHKKIREFHSKNIKLIVQTWNQLRPMDCRVGPISLLE